GDTGNDTLLGDNGANGLFGLAGMDIINGAGGNDLIVGGIGNDMLSGGAGNDTFVFALGDGNDTITDFTAGGIEDTIDLTGLNAFAGFADVMASAQQVGSDVVLDFGSGDSITLGGTMLADLTVDDFLI
ncbi:MAG: calcium-binding protein, partial [Rhodospirillaceae bacterium]|nr:calcium-binding protein [Rhodospirillaceae bacterium]